MTEFLQHCLNALMLGGTYALLGIGLTLIFGIMRVVNFTHGELYALSHPVARRGETPRSAGPPSPRAISGQVDFPAVIAGLGPATPIAGHGRAIMIGVAGTSPAMTIQ